MDWTDDDVVLLCVKSQDTQRALIDLETTAPEDVRLVCLQNGVANEPAALRRFANVYGAHVLVPAAFLEPGVVTAYSTPVPGIIDVGRFPRGVDDVAREVRGALAGAGFSSQPIGEIRRWKYRKLLSNLGNAAQALLVAGDDVTRVTRIAVAEGEAALAAAGVDVAGRNEDARRRADWIRLAPVDGGHAREGRPGRACAAAPARSRPTTSTVRSCCWGGCTVSRRPATRCCAGSPRRRRRQDRHLR